MNATQKKLSSSWSILKETAAQWSHDDAMRRSAALAYYAIFSLAPLFILLTAIAGFALGEEAARSQIGTELTKLAGDQVGHAIQAVARNAGRRSSGIIAASVGVLALLFGASGVFSELKASLNSIWGVAVKPGQTIFELARTRVLSFAMVLGIGFLLVLSLVVSAVIAGITTFLRQFLPIPGWVLASSDFALSLVVTAVLFAMIFKILPDVELRWRDVLLGAAGSALLFTIGKFLIGFYLGTSSVVSSYGAAGSAIVILLWVYYSSGILFFGAEFTKTLVRRRGCPIVPTANAALVNSAPNAGNPPGPQ